jgi:phosphate transport system permease protein
MWKVILSVTLRAVRGGVDYGNPARRRRMSGETAPLSVHGAQQPVRQLDMNAPMANLPVVIFQFALSPYDDWKSSRGAARS